MSSVDNFARASLNQALAWIMTGRRIRQGQERIIAESFIYSADYRCAREKLKYALQDRAFRDNGLLAWGIEQGNDEHSEIPVDCWTDESKIDYFNSAIEYSVYCRGYLEIYVQTDELVDCFPVPESERSKNPLDLADDILAGCIPQAVYGDISPPPGECLAVEVIEHLGKDLFPDDWTGQERDIYQNGYCWINGAFSNLLAYDKPDMFLGYISDAVQAGRIKPYWKLFKDMPEQEYFSNLHELRDGIHPRLKKDDPLLQHAQDFIADLKGCWPEIRGKAKLLRENFREVRTRWDQAFDELIARVANKARLFDFSGMNDPISIPGNRWFTDTKDLYRGGLQTGMIYRQCYKTLGLPENGKWAVLVSEGVLGKSDNVAAVRKRKKTGRGQIHDWGKIDAEMRNYISENGLPEMRDSLVGHIQGKCQEDGRPEPTLSTLRQHASTIYAEFQK